MSYAIDLYHNTSDPNHFNKSITLVASTSCDIKSPVDVENPELYITATDSFDSVNYVYIPEFHRYYFAKAVVKHGYLITYECVSDPLMSFKSSILACKAVISRNPWHFDLYLPDAKMPIETRNATCVLKFPNASLFNGNNNCYVLTTLGPGTPPEE